MLYQIFFSILLLGVQTDKLSISGAILSPEATPVANATITIENSAENRHWELTTSASGVFKLDDLSLGTYRLSIHKDGFFDAQTDVRLEASKTIEFTLTPSERLSQTIEVIARPEPINVDSVSVGQSINSEAIQNLPFTGRRNFLNALALTPGVVNDNTGGIHIHGSSAGQIRYQLDGMNLTDPGSGALSSRIPIDAIESVDLDLAGYSAESGKGSGGVVRVHSQFIEDRFHWNFTDFIPGINFNRWVIGQMTPRLSLSGPVAANRVWFLYSGSSRYVPTYNEDLPEERNRTSETVIDQLLKTQWNVAESDVVTVSLLHNAEFYRNQGLSLNRPIESTTNYLRRSLTGSVSNRAVVAGRVLETTLQWTRGHESDLPRGTQPMEIRPEGWSGHFFAERRTKSERIHIAQTVAWEARSHRFKSGFEVDDVHSDLFLKRRDFDVFNAQGLIESSAHFYGPTGATVHNREYGAFFQDRMTLRKNLQFEMGLRMDRESIIGRTNFGPRIAFSYLPFGGDRAKLSGGAGMFYDSVPLENFQIPYLQRRDASMLTVAPDLESPYGINWNLSWEQEWKTRWVTRINYINKHGRDQIRIAAPLEVNNSGVSRYRALELSLDRPVRTNLRVLASYVYSMDAARPSLSVDFPDPAAEDILDARTSWDAPHRFLAWGYFPFWLQTNASFSVEARSGFPYTAVDNQNRIVRGYNSTRFPTFFVVNASFEKEMRGMFGKRIAVRLGVLNALNRFNPRFMDLNVNSPTYGRYSDSTGRALVARLRLVK